jgi:hypothetical protein
LEASQFGWFGSRKNGASLTMTGCGAAKAAPRSVKAGFAGTPDLRRAASFNPGVTRAKSFRFGVEVGVPPWRSGDRVIGLSGDRKGKTLNHKGHEGTQSAASKELREKSFLPRLRASAVTLHFQSA